MLWGSALQRHSEWLVEELKRRSYLEGPCNFLSESAWWKKRMCENYNGRDTNGQIQITRFGDGKLMTQTCAEEFCKVLRVKYPQVRVVELNRGDRDELAAETLADLGEQTPLETLAQAVKDCVRFGNSHEQILTAVEASVFQMQP
jgi:hypothetical protein